MALQIVTKKRFISSMKKTTSYLKQEWNKPVAVDFVKIVDKKITLLASQPNIGSNTSIKNTKSVLAGRGYQNRIYYRVENNKLIIVNIKDIRKSPKKIVLTNKFQNEPTLLFPRCFSWGHGCPDDTGK